MRRIRGSSGQSRIAILSKPVVTGPQDLSDLNWNNSCYRIGDQAKASLGSYSLQATVTAINGRTATVTYTGYNETTLGSAIGLIPSTRPFLNSSAESLGVGRKIEQHFMWTETITW